MIKDLFKLNSPRTRIALGLVSMVVCLLIAASYLGLFPNRHAAVLEGRAALAETVAVNSSVFITRNDLRRMEANLELMVKRNNQLLSAAVKNEAGKTLVEIGEHDMHWEAVEGGLSTDAQITVPIFEGDSPWGRIELRFIPLKSRAWYAFFLEPLSILIMFMGLTCYVFFHLYLGRMLKALDPSQAIPDRVRSALDTMAEGLLVLDAKHNIVLANEAFASLMDQQPDDLLGQKIAKLAWQKVDDQAADDAPYPWELALEQSEVQLNYMLRLKVKDAKQRTFMTNCSPVLGPNGKAAGVLVSFDDVTELEEKEIQLRISKEEAEAANRAKSDFLANMSHEIRTPMNAILGFTEVLKRGYGKDPEESKRYLATIASSGKHLLDLINDILDLSKVEAGRIEVERISCQAHQVVQEVVKIMRVKASEKGIALDLKATTVVPEYVQTDPSRLRQIITNLVGNAIKFTEQGGVTVTIAYHGQGDQAQLEVAVADTGIGMTQAQADAVFNPFVQADSSITRRFGGTGLGLTISKRFAEALGGDITVTSAPGEGSCFTVNVLAEASEHAALLPPEEVVQESALVEESQSVNWRFAGQRILVVDDGDENRDLLEVVLSDVGLNIDTACDGKEGLDLACANDYAMILMDVQMPEMDGYTSVGLMRERGLTLPVIALTAHAMKGAEQKCLDAGYSGYMTKPIDIDALLARLANALDAEQISAEEAQAAVIASQEVPMLVAKAESMQTEAVVPSLPMHIPKFRELVERFIPRLRERMQELQTAASNQELDVIADIAHWLKGSAGSVGFHQFTEPAAELEVSAKEGRVAAVNTLLKDVLDLAQRVQVSAGESAIGSQSSATQSTTGCLEAPAPAEPIESELLRENVRLRPMAVKFVKRLEEKLAVMQAALNAASYAELADEAHWLKGSAGTLGFHQFTEPALELENAAKEENAMLAADKLASVQDLAVRIQLPEQQSNETNQKIS
ncbi:MAG: ATP-binding protein [Oleiphilaceae bacterium]|nr:ATP-binding protein [Oleiphilaceae bacterium]